MKTGRLEYGLLAAAVMVFLICCIVTSPYQSTAMMLGVAETEEQTPQVALTFDDGPHLVYTPLLLAGLREREVRATFFVIGKNIIGKEDIIKQMHEEGHLIGNHTYDHVQLTKLSSDAACAEIWKANTTVFDSCGIIPTYIRPPFGSWDEELACAIDMQTVLWDVDPRDWNTQDADQVVEHVLKHVKDGDIILLHDVYQTSVEAAFRIVDELTRQGYEFVTVDELLLD
jgi:peptidoglycan/xylan/chitin deacetylase (PgdA/CDA1 family)